MHHHFMTGLLWMIALNVLGIPSVNTIGTPTIEYSFTGGSTITANGNTNVKPFSCVCFFNEMSPTSQVTLSVNADNSVAFFKNAILKVNIEALDCGNNGINNDLSRVLKASQYPYILIRIKDAGSISHKPIDLSKQAEMKVDADISMAGVTRQDTIVMEGGQIGKSLFHFTGQHPLHLSEYGIKPPTALFGLIKVRNTIIIRFDLKVSIHIIS